MYSWWGMTVLQTDILFNIILRQDLQKMLGKEEIAQTDFVKPAYGEREIVVRMSLWCMCIGPSGFC